MLNRLHAFKGPTQIVSAVLLGCAIVSTGGCANLDHGGGFRKSAASCDATCDDAGGSCGNETGDHAVCNRSSCQGAAGCQSCGKNGRATRRSLRGGRRAKCGNCGDPGCPKCSGACGGCGRVGLRGRLFGLFCGHRSNAIPETLPLGSTIRAHYQVMETNGEAADFIFHRHDFVGQTAQLTPDGRDKIPEIAVRMRSAPFPVLIERSQNNCDPELDLLRRNLVAQLLTEFGTPDADCRTIVSPSYGHGYNAIQAEPSYYQYLFQGRGYNNGYGNGFGGGLGGGLGGGFGGGLGGGFGGGFGGGLGF